MTAAPPPVEKTLWVPLDPDRAFDLFTRRIGEWWPVASHSLSASRHGSVPTSVTTEPREGGRILETCADGTIAPWATITAWEPGVRLGLDWHVGRPEAEATRVTVRFAAENGGTRLDLRHDGFDALPERAQAIRDNYQTGWDLVLIERFGAAAARPA